MPFQPPRRIYTTSVPRARSQGRKSVIKSQGPPLLYGEDALRAMEPIYASPSRPPFWESGAKSGLQIQKINHTPTIATVKNVMPLAESTEFVTPAAPATADPLPKNLASSYGGFTKSNFGPRPKFGVFGQRSTFGNYEQKSNFGTSGQKSIGQYSQNSTGFGQVTADDKPGVLKLKLPIFTGNKTQKESDNKDEPKKPFDIFGSRSRRAATSIVNDPEEEKCESNDDEIPNWSNKEFRKKCDLSRKLQYWTRKEYEITAPKKKSSKDKDKGSKVTADNLDSNLPTDRLLISDAYQMDAEMVLKNATKLILQSSKLREDTKSLLQTEVIPKEKAHSSKTKPRPSFKNTPKGTFRYAERRDSLLKRGYNLTDIDEFLLGRDWKKTAENSEYVPSILTHRANAPVKGETAKTNISTFGAFDPKLRHSSKDEQKKPDLPKTVDPGNNKKPVYAPYMQGKVLPRPMFGPTPKNMISRKVPASMNRKLAAKSSSSFDIGSTLDFNPRPISYNDLKLTKNILQQRFKDVLMKENQEVNKIRDNSKESSVNTTSFIQRIIENNRPKQRPKSPVKFGHGRMNRSKTTDRPKQGTHGQEVSQSKAATGTSDLESTPNVGSMAKDKPVKTDSKKRSPSKKRSGSKTKKSSSKAQVVDSLEDIKQRLVNPRNVEVRKKIKMQEIGRVMNEISKATAIESTKDGDRILSMERVSIMPVLIPFNGGVPQLRTPASGPFEVTPIESVAKTFGTKDAKGGKPN